MPNSIFNATQMNSLMGGTNQLYSLYNMMKNSGNPMAILQNMAMSNPQLQPVINSLQQGNSPEQVFRQLAGQRGINPDEFIRNIQGSMR